MSVKGAPIQKSQQIQQIERDTCRCLRTKGMFIDSDPDPTVPSTDSGIYWCIHTMNQLGPDGEVARPRDCGTGRGCWEKR